MVHVQGLESLGISSEKYGSLLIPVILSRMPSEIALQVARKTSEDIWSIDDIMSMIQREIEAREVSYKISVQDVKKCEKPTKNLPVGTTKTFVTKSDKSKQSIECYFCNKDHYSSSCKEVTDPSERKAIITAAKRCYNCLRIGHNAKECRQTQKCYNCNGRHNTALCTSGAKTKPNTSITTSSIREKIEVLLRTAKTYTYGGDRGKKVPVTILFDGGSQKTFVSEELQKTLDLKWDKFESLNLNTFGSEQYVKKRCERVEINLEVGDAIVKISALSSPALCSPINSRLDISSYPHLKCLSLANGVGTANSRVDVLIGADYYYDIVIGDVIRGSGRPVAISSKLGWLLPGPVFSYSHDASTCNNINSNLVLDILPSREEVLDPTKEIVSSVDRFWKHEAMGIESSESAEKVSQLEVKFKEKDQRYEVCLPWKNDVDGKWESNYELCKSRLFSLYKKLKENPVLMKQYDDVFKEQLENGVIEKVRSQGKEADSKAHFLCHFGVARQERETTKLRVVFDGSAKWNIDSLSLNDRLEVGANHMPLLFDTVIRIRLHSIAMIADIKKAFLRVQINETDRDKVRFLWFDDVGKENPVVVEYRYCRLVFGLTCSPSILAETIKYHISQFPHEDSKILNMLDKLYRDDLSCRVDTKEEAINLYKRCKEIMLKGGFNLRKWLCNDKVVQVEIDNLERLRGAKNSQVQGSSKSALGVPNNIEGANKVLGVIWDSDKDTLELDLCYVVEFARTLPATKRSVLRIAAKIFDPMGYLTVLTINFKAFFQRLCIDKVPWDETFTGEYMRTYESLLRLLAECPHICIPRYLFSHGEQPSRIEIHRFSDASEKAFASVVYLRAVYLTGKVETKLIASKSKVALAKQQSIPRLVTN